jgi:hypothetical protein
MMNSSSQGMAFNEIVDSRANMEAVCLRARASALRSSAACARSQTLPGSALSLRSFAHLSPARPARFAGRFSRSVRRFR